MATYKGKLEQKTGTTTSDVLYPETSADQVTYDSTTSGLQATNVQDAIDSIMATGTGVTGVKGDAEDNYRTGQVNLTAANIGAEAAFADGSATIATVSSDVVTLKAGVGQSSGTVTQGAGNDITLAKVAKTGNYNDLSNKPTINDATLTLQIEGTTKTTFTANSSTAATFNVTAADLGLSSPMNYIGVATTTQPIGTEGTYIKTSIGSTTYYVIVTPDETAAEVSAQKGYVISVNTKEYVCTTAGTFGTNAFTELGDEGSYALKTITISAGTGLTGGGSLAQDRTLSLANNYGDTKNPYASKTANQVLAAPNGSNGTPSFRALVAADIPALNYVTKPGATLGSTTKPIYYDATNGLVEASTYAGGTKVTLNGSNKGGSTATIYAPTAAPTAPSADTKAYLVGTSATTTLSTEYTDSKVYFKNDKLYSNDAEVLTGNQTITLSGDVTGSGTTAITAALSATGVTADTYSAVTVDTKGRVTAGAQVFKVIENSASTTGIANNGLFFRKNA